MQQFFATFKNKPALYILILLIVVGFLIYLNLHPNLLQRRTSPIPASKPVSPANTTGIVLAISQHPKYSLTLTDSQKLADYFKALGIFGKTYNEKVQKDTLPVAKIIVVLTANQNQVIAQKDQAGKEIFAYSLVFLKDTLFINGYLPPDILAGGQAAQIFQNGVISAVSKLESTAKATLPQAVFIITPKVQITPPATPSAR